MAQIGQHLVATDVDRAEHHRLIARCLQHIAVEPGLPLTRRERGRNQKLEFCAEQPDPVGPGQRQIGQILAQPGVDHQGNAGAIGGARLNLAQPGIARLPLARLGIAAQRRLGDLGAKLGGQRAVVRHALLRFGAVDIEGRPQNWRAHFAPINSRPISIRLISFVPAPMSSSLASRK